MDNLIGHFVDVELLDPRDNRAGHYEGGLNNLKVRDASPAGIEVIEPGLHYSYSGPVAVWYPMVRVAKIIRKCGPEWATQCETCEATR